MQKKKEVNRVYILFSLGSLFSYLFCLALSVIFQDELFGIYAIIFLIWSLHYGEKT